MLINAFLYGGFLLLDLGNKIGELVLKGERRYGNFKRRKYLLIKILNICPSAFHFVSYRISFKHPKKIWDYYSIIVLSKPYAKATKCSRNFVWINSNTSSD